MSDISYVHSTSSHDCTAEVISSSDSHSENVVSDSPSFGNDDVRSQEMDLTYQIFDENVDEETKSDKASNDAVYSKVKSVAKNMTGVSPSKFILLMPYTYS